MDYEGLNSSSCRYHNCRSKLTSRGFRRRPQSLSIVEEKRACEEQTTWYLEDSNCLLPSYVVRLTGVDPAGPDMLSPWTGQVIFEVFWAFRPYISNNKCQLKRVICVERTQLSGKYFDTLSSLRIWSIISSLAFAVVESKNKASCTWFYVQMRDAIIDMKHDLVIISNKQKGLVDAIPIVLPNVYHSYCL